MNEKIGVDFRYYFTYRNVKQEIIFAPDGWDTNSKVSYKRDPFYFGIIRAFALPLDFVNDAARLLRRAYYTDGVMAGVRIDVEQLNRSTLAYEQFFTGDIDFSKKQDDGVKFTATLMQSGPSERIKAYESIKYEFDLVGDDVVNMILPGVAFSDSAQGIFDFLPNPGAQRYVPGISMVIPLVSAFVETHSTAFETANDTYFSGSSNWFAKGNRDQLIRIRGYIKGNFQFSSSSGMQIRIMNQANTVIKTLYSTTSKKADFNFSFDETLTIHDQEKFFIYCRSESTGGAWLSVITEGEINVSYNSVSDPSNCSGIKALDMFKRVMRRIDGRYPAISNLLSTTWENLIFTSGNGIREIPGATIKISLKDLFQTFLGLDDVGLGTDSVNSILELKTYFMRNVQSVDVGEIGDLDCVLSYDEERAGSGIKVGYKDGNTQETNGLQEYNSGSNWQLPITRVQNIIDWVCVARADQFGIEKLRVDYNILKAKGTNDMPGDNDTFIVDCYKDGVNYRPILGSSYDLVEGLTSEDTAYNLRITPKKNLLRHGAYMHGIMTRMNTAYINFASADKNANLRTVKGGESVQENANIIVGNLPPAYFISDAATIKCALPKNANKLFTTSPFGYVKFKWRSQILKGFILDCGVDIARNTEQEFKLLLTVDNNLLNLTNL